TQSRPSPADLRSQKHRWHASDSGPGAVASLVAATSSLPWSWSGQRHAKDNAIPTGAAAEEHSGRRSEEAVIRGLQQLAERIASIVVKIEFVQDRDDAVRRHLERGARIRGAAADRRAVEISVEPLDERSVRRRGVWRAPESVQHLESAVG